jgi:plasmid stabilization system protein ParE
MPGFRLTKAAKADMRGIGRYTRTRWGRDQRLVSCDLESV